MTTFSGFRKNWAMLFTAGVCIYFVISTLPIGEYFSGLPKGKRDADHIANIDQSAAKTKSATFSFEVKKFHIDVNKKKPGKMDVVFILEVGNETKSNLSFNADKLLLHPIGSELLSSPVDKNAKSITISPQSPVMIPVTFEISLDTFSGYELLYQGESIFSGQPL